MYGRAILILGESGLGVGLGGVGFRDLLMVLSTRSGGYWLRLVKTFLRCCISGLGSVATLRARLARVEIMPILVLGGD